VEQEIDKELRAMRQRINLLSLRLRLMQMQQAATILVLHEIYQQQVADLEKFRE
jgi:hypothetical protein